ncbi:hypothetical protein JCM30471_07530 [Desulfuromonas carbonis]|uniref:general secretion pathway protein GspB n=1 Tax=Desulfuromonas sp. DDH964 TaxID=1823759 RepID=UPI00078D6D2A|nr:general secretion pathway protein GspB [Desulfuromonas sp. DDH964]AMV72268.1 hypothetical protein DBW_1915 [Desulfuromonas sp. DDH964]
MSLILDALKKAEADRRQTQPPSPVTTFTAEAPPRSRRNWLLGLVILGGLGGAAILIWWLHPWASVVGSVEASKVTVQPPSISQFQEKEPAAPPKVIPPPVLPVTAPKPEPDPPLVTPSSSKPAVAVTPKRVPSLRELAPADRVRLPEINLQLHFYTADPARRLVRINGTNLHEGEEGGGLHVIQIRPADVVLGVGGVEFSLPAGRP